ncbi:dihydroxy-acid dehydratase [Pilimelia columellifera]|uniref:Dihydroxy-acid dehydratase n=1 Tax=Pilimelia columellifera subsp. columellifera TaxID=706583 RepID=A0ABN3NIV6_9ACTN
MPELRFRTILTGRSMAGARARQRATGIDPAADRPIVAIANSFTSFSPAHAALRHLGDLAADAIARAGGTGREFGVPAIDAGIAVGDDAARHLLPSRENVADTIEQAVTAHHADAVICVAAGGATTAGMLQAILRLNLPAIIVNAGPMAPGQLGSRSSGPGAPVTRTDLAVAAGDSAVSDDLLAAMELVAYPTYGECATYTAGNAMACLVEALGLAVPGNGTTPLSHVARRRLVEASGALVVDLADRWHRRQDPGALPRFIANTAAFRQATLVDAALGGHPDVALHLLAAAAEAGVALSLADLDAIARDTPWLARLDPAGKPGRRHTMADLHRAGGVPALLGELRRAGLLDTTAPAPRPAVADAGDDAVGPTHSADLDAWLEAWDVRGGHAGAAAVDLFRAAPLDSPSTQAFATSARSPELDTAPTSGCIRDAVHPHATHGGLAVLTGNLSPDSCVARAGNRPLSLQGPARVFDATIDAVAAIADNQILPGDVVVIRYEGPRGGPGMPDIGPVLEALAGKGRTNDCAVITDGRLGDHGDGLAIGHVSPEAAEGGPLALVQDGDEIAVDVSARSLTLVLAPEELTLRQVLEEKKDHPYTPVSRRRPWSAALAAFAGLAGPATVGVSRRLHD